MTSVTLTSRNRNVGFWWTRSCRTYFTAGGGSFLAPDITQCHCSYVGSLEGALRAYYQVYYSDPSAAMTCYLTVGGVQVDRSVLDVHRDWREAHMIGDWYKRAPKLEVPLIDANESEEN